MWFWNRQDAQTCSLDVHLFAHDEQGTALHLVENLAHIQAEDAHDEELQSSDEPEGEDGRRIAGDANEAQTFGNHIVQRQQKGNSRHAEPQTDGELQGPVGVGDNQVGGKA